MVCCVVSNAKELNRSGDALLILTLIPSIPSLLLVLSIETVLISSPGEVGEEKKLLGEVPFRYA